METQMAQNSQHEVYTIYFEESEMKSFHSEEPAPYGRADNSHSSELLPKKSSMTSCQKAMSTLAE